MQSLPGVSPRRSTRLSALLFAAFELLSLFVSSGVARADDKRPPQDYGRPAESTDAGDILAWPVRVVLFPLWLVNEFILRRPLGAVVKASERGQWIEQAQDFFSFGARNQVTIYPSALFDFGLLPSVGFNLTWKYLGAEDNTLKVHFGTWGFDWLNLKAEDTYDLSKSEHLVFGATFTRRRDNPFFGIGPRTKQDDRVRFAFQTFEVAPGYLRDFGTSSTFETSAGFRGLDYFDGTCCGDPSLGDAIASGRLAPPPGLGHGYIGGFQRASLSLDSRRQRPAPGSGLRAEVHEETMYVVDERVGAPRRSWIRYGGAVGGALDITGTQRVLALTVDAELADPIIGEIPFTEQVALGGKGGLMSGYIRNRLVDRSAAVATLQYTWPIWVYLDGLAHVAAGNVFGTHFDQFSFEKSRLSAGIGLRSNGDRDSGFEFIVGAGTDPIDEGFRVSSFRLLVGSHHGL